MPTLMQTTQGRVTGLWGSALIKGPDGQMRALKMGDLVHRGDVILTTQDGIVQLTADETPVAAAAIKSAPATDIDRVISDLNQNDPDAATAAGLNGGDGGEFLPGLRVDRIQEELTPAGLAYSGTSAPGNTTEAGTGATVNNIAPVAQNGVVSGDEDSTLPVPLTGADGDGSVASITVTSIPPGSTLLLADGTTVVLAGQTLTPQQAAGLLLQPSANFNGQTGITFFVTDNEGLASDPATVTISVISVNDAPVAAPLSASGPEDTPLAVSLTGSDVDGTVTSFTITQLPTNGTLFLSDGTTPVVPGTPLSPAEAANLVFVPAANFHGTVNLIFTVTDNEGLPSAPRTVPLTITPVNDAPDAINDTASAPHNTSISVPVLGNDTDPDGDPLTVTSATLVNPGQGSVSIGPNGTLQFTPAPGFSGTALVNYSISDGHGGTDTATVTITVAAAPPPPPTGPDAIDDSGSTQVDTPLTIAPATLLGNDTDGNSDPLTITSVQGGVNGSVAIVAGNVVFTPTAGYTGPATFPYTNHDGHGGTDTATVNISVSAAPNLAPDAIDDSGSTQVDTPLTITPATLLGNDTDGNSDPLTITSVQGGINGSVAIVAGNVVFTPTAGYTGPASFTYTISDGHGGTDTATVNITVSA
ncbi:MAG: Ig-like domain-containing protein, partial [Burkholderiaceae bacterium]|nr:Ig-like domain-containing protein [Burkholderiaceae bacterium]